MKKTLSCQWFSFKNWLNCFFKLIFQNYDSIHVSIFVCVLFYSTHIWCAVWSWVVYFKSAWKIKEKRQARSNGAPISALCYAPLRNCETMKRNIHWRSDWTMSKSHCEILDHMFLFVSRKIYRCRIPPEIEMYKLRAVRLKKATLIRHRCGPWPTFLHHNGIVDSCLRSFRLFHTNGWTTSKTRTKPKQR